MAISVLRDALVGLVVAARYEASAGFFISVIAAVRVIVAVLGTPGAVKVAGEAVAGILAFFRTCLCVGGEVVDC